MDKVATRSALIDMGRKMIFETGFNHTGIQAVLSAADVPKGSFYYYFSSKEEFGLAVIDDFVASHLATRERFLSDESLSPIHRLRRYFEHYVQVFEGRGFHGGCLLGNLGQELADQNDVFRARVEEAFNAWRAGTARCLREAREAGEIAPHWDEQVLADFCLSGWQGAILRMKVTRSRVPLDVFIETLFDGVLAAR